MQGNALRYFPIFIDLREKHVVVSGTSPAALAKVRLLLKTEARLSVFGGAASRQFDGLAARGKLALVDRPIQAADLSGVHLLYSADDDPAEAARVLGLARSAGVLCNRVDSAEDSDFLTPAIIDRDPVTVAIGTEGTAPVLARRIKAAVEEMLPSGLGSLARIAARFRPLAASLPAGHARRALWDRFFGETGPRALAAGGEAAAEAALSTLAAEFQAARPEGHVHFIGAGPGDPELLTLKARRLIAGADVIMHDRLVSPEVLDLARREASFIEVGKTPGGKKSWRQGDINDLLIAEAGQGRRVARLKSGDPGIYGRLDEEADALSGAGIPFDIVPGVTAASAAAAAAGLSLTRRGRNAALRILTGHGRDGYVEQDWHSLAGPDAVAAVYMGVRASGFLQGRLLMHGRSADTPVTVVENASRADQKIVSATLGNLAARLRENGIDGPAILFLGLARRDDRPVSVHPAHPAPLIHADTLPLPASVGRP